MSRTSPFVNLVVIRSPDIDQAVCFYQAIGLVFEKHSHGSGPEHYASESDGFVFEIYPLKTDGLSTTAVRLGFVVSNIDSIVAALADLGADILSQPKASQWGRRSVVKDLDGHTVELVQS